MKMFSAIKHVLLIAKYLMNSILVLNLRRLTVYYFNSWLNELGFDVNHLLSYFFGRGQLRMDNDQIVRWELFKHHRHFKIFIHFFLQ